LFASTGTKDAKASDVLYVRELIAPLTVNTMPEATLQAFAAHGEVGGVLSPDGRDSAEVLREFAHAGIDTEALAKRLQEEGAAAFVTSWQDLLAVIGSKTTAAVKEAS
jgi:transaldolase